MDKMPASHLHQLRSYVYSATFSVLDGTLCHMAEPAWLQPVITGVATLSGAALGVVGTYLAQRGVWNKQYGSRWDEVRRVAYSRILSVCNSWHDAIAKGDPEQAEALSNEFVQVTGEVSLLVNESTRSAARDLGNFLWALQNRTIAKGAKWDSGEFPAYQQLRDAFREAARKEIKIS